jgi:hypothetical protein
VSATTSNAPPARTLAGNSSRWSLPMTSRSACGTTSPTKPTLPAVVTAAAVASAASALDASIVRSTETPSAAATCSPRASTLRSRAKASEPASVMTSTTSAGVASVVPPRSPISQNSIPLTRASGAIVSISAMTAPHPAATTTPVSSSLVVVHGARSPPILASVNTSTVDASAPPSAAGVTSGAAPASMAPSAPTAAPPEMPRMYGSASGLRRSTCINAPESASKAPTANAASARGSRNSRTMAEAVCVVSPPSARTIADAPTSMLPTASDAPSATRAATASTRRIAARRAGLAMPGNGGADMAGEALHQAAFGERRL